jgi:RIO-like serine/threonine protein kinase
MLRGEKVRTKDFPDLREDHQRLLQAGDAQMEQYAFVNVEVDRITNSLNMLREQVTKWVRAQKGG